MKKLLLALGALATLAMVAPSCEKPGPNQEPKKEEVKELSVNPTSLELYKGDKIKFALTGADVNVTLVPNSASYTLESSDANIAKVEGKIVTAMNEGNATITVKAGDKTATVALTVKATASFDETRFLGGKDIYVPVFDGNMKAKKAEIEAAMESREWKKGELPNEVKNLQLYFIPKEENTPKVFPEILYVHTPTSGAQFMKCFRLMEQDGTWEQGMGKKMLEHYGFSEGEVQASTLTDETPCLAAYKDEFEILLFIKRQVVGKDKDNNDIKKDVYQMQISKKKATQNGTFVDLSEGVNMFNPLNRIF